MRDPRGPIIWIIAVTAHGNRRSVHVTQDHVTSQIILVIRLVKACSVVIDPFHLIAVRVDIIKRVAGDCQGRPVAVLIVGVGHVSVIKAADGAQALGLHVQQIIVVIRTGNARVGVVNLDQPGSFIVAKADARRHPAIVPSGPGHPIELVVAESLHFVRAISKRLQAPHRVVSPPLGAVNVHAVLRVGDLFLAPH